LAAIGYKNVRDYAGGKRDWVQAKLPLEGVGPQK
jgi:rhodanese-related sulfurtransferase